METLRQAWSVSATRAPRGNLSPKLIRDFGVAVNDDAKGAAMEAKAIHDEQGYKDVRRRLSRYYDVARKTRTCRSPTPISPAAAGGATHRRARASSSTRPRPSARCSTWQPAGLPRQAGRAGGRGQPRAKEHEALPMP